MFERPTPVHPTRFSDANRRLRIRMHNTHLSYTIPCAPSSNSQDMDEALARLATLLRSEASS